MVELTSAVQESLLCLAAYDEQHAHSVFGLVAPELFDTFYRDVAQSIAAYHEKYRKAPGEHTYDLLEVLRARHPADADVYAQIHDSMVVTSEGVNAAYVLDQARLFARHQHLKRAVAQVIDLAQQGTPDAIDEAEAIMASSARQAADLFDPGTFLTDTDKSLAFLDRERDAFLTGIEPLDRYNLGPSRKRVHLLMGEYGSGKSWWLVHMARMGLLQRLRVLYVSLELDEAEVSQRIFQNLFSIGKRREEQPWLEPVVGPDGTFLEFRDRVLKGRPSLQDEDIRKVLTDKIRGLRRRAPLLVKEFPTGQLTMPQLSAYLRALEVNSNFLPDMMLVDYPDLMRVDPTHQRQALDAIYKDLRGMAKERNMAVVIVTQANRAAAGSKTITGKHVTEHWGKMAHVDVALTHNQSDAEKRLGLARIYVDKARTDRGKFSVLVPQAYGFGQYGLGAVLMDADVQEALDREQGDDVNR